MKLVVSIEDELVERLAELLDGFRERFKLSKAEMHFCIISAVSQRSYLDGFFSDKKKS